MGGELKVDHVLLVNEFHVYYKGGQVRRSATQSRWWSVDF